MIMKHLIYILGILLGCTTLFTSCKGNTYARLLEQEKKNINTYISSHGYEVFEGDEPADNYDWAGNPNAWYKVKGYDYFYYRLDVMGDTTQKAILPSETAVVRYRRYTLTEPYDTASYWTTLNAPDPLEFAYVTDQSSACVAWHVAIGLMKYPGSQARIICPSKLGFSEEQNSVTPYGYDLKLKIKR